MANPVITIRVAATEILKTIAGSIVGYYKVLMNGIFLLYYGSLKSYKLFTIGHSWHSGRDWEIFSNPSTLNTERLLQVGVRLL